MEPHAHQNLSIGFDDTSKSVKYYKSDTWRILISRNFCFLTLMNEELPNDDLIAPEIDLPPNILCDDNTESNAQTIKRMNESDVSGPQSNNESQGQGDKRNLQKKP